MIVWLGAGVPLLALVGLGAGILGAVIGGYLAFCRDLPDIPDLRAYRPKTVTTFYAEDGTVIGLFYTEKRFPIPLDTIPDHVVHAFLAAEDARFFSHPGVDLIGVIRAVVTNIKTANFAQGASTITQQVTRNFLLSKEKKFKRKIREAILAFRLEKTLTKREILQLYVNEIYFGKGAYGIEAAARTYFGKTTAELSIAEAALLAGVVASPSKFAPHRNLEGSLHRRDLVLDSMLRNAFISEDQRRFAAEETPSFRENLPNTYQRAPHFVEAVRQYIASQYGEDRVYNDGLQVWTTCDLALDNLASQALLKGAKAWEARQQRPPGLVKRLKPAEARMFVEGPDSEAYEPGDIVETLVLSNDTPKKRDKKKKTEDHFQECTLALAGGAKFQMRLESKVPFRPNDLLQFRVVKTEGTRITLEPEILPPVEGAVVCIENNTGYVRALVGGLDFERSRFNRASQAVRQPGSAFKPFVYTAALEYGLYGPHSIVVDEPIAVIISAHEPEWVPMNSDGSFLGPITLRQALAQSRNVAAVKLIMDVGVEPTIEMARAMGIESRLGKNLSLSLGASEVTPLELTSAYTVFPNMGVRVAPVLVKKVVDRFGKVLEDNTMEPLDISKVADQPPRTFAAPDPAIEEGDD
ncbi:MAG: transglycosylase domain-containing protein, partial [Deltaproteobacteria bacterium]|nr:transglycosylase domain-containing protein [Deltaproteobacteria bacterium]